MSVRPTMLRAMRGLDGFSLKPATVRVGSAAPGQLHLWRNGDRFPLAGGDIRFIRSNFRRLTGAA